ncbi:sigma-54 interaction domain-containing protein [Bacilliculturomica massiliensis]|uniref:sigma-54 interaction domain-containing protein n=1 Tax=Bacilliculturomica massiliensis TaxID=1917867 RepID=UPI0013EF2A91|nr:sigma 54-interacting transcriptional regulator [Bacilliculturomica massiliensis]
MNKYFEKNLRLVDYIDGLMVVDKDFIIRHFYTAYPDIVKLGREEPINRSLFEIYPGLKQEDSYICRALKYGESFINYEQTYEDYKGNKMDSISSAVPIKEQGEIIGVIDMVIYKCAHVDARRLSFDTSLIATLKKSYNSSNESLDDIISQDASIQGIKERIVDMADSDAHVLVYGKTGTGKELVVNAIQKMSRRKDAPFIKQNCAAIPSSLLESILFGTTRGSYTGAQDTPGLFELADGGTLFLDEMNSMELDAQAKLLRVLEENKIRRIGGKEEKKVNVRIIAAMNEEPEMCVEKKKIRADIFYRLCVLRYDIPELRDRRGDIPLLMEYFRKQLNKKMNKQIIAYTEEVQDIFYRYDWPGNVRELKNVIESAFHNNHEAIITRNDIPNYIIGRLELDNICKEEGSRMSLSDMLSKYEILLIREAYERNGCRLTQTAKELQISKQNLAYKMKKYGIK